MYFCNQVLELSYWCVELGNFCRYCPRLAPSGYVAICAYLETDRMRPNLAEIRGRFRDSGCARAHNRAFPRCISVWGTLYVTLPSDLTGKRATRYSLAGLV